MLHKIFNQQINKYIRAEIIYENYPVVAGTDELSLILRFRYIGEPTQPVQKPTPNEDSSESLRSHSRTQSISNDGRNGGWFGGRLSRQFTDATRGLFLQQLNESDNGAIPEENSINKNDLSLYLANTQILGCYSLNDKIIDTKIFDGLQKDTIIGGKLAGITGLNSNSTNTKNGLFNALGSLFNAEINDLGSENNHSELRLNHLIPFYSTSQSILFSEISFDPSEQMSFTKSFYVNIKLPKDLPPNYKSRSVQISYNFVLGYQLLQPNGSFVSKSIFFPLKVQPFIDQFGRQPLYHLETHRINSRPKIMKNTDINGRSSFSAAAAGPVQQQTRPLRGHARKVSFKSIKRRMSADMTGSSFDGSMRRLSTANNANEPKTDASSLIGPLALHDDLPEEFDLKNEPKTQQFLKILDDLNNSEVINIIKVQEKFESEFNNKSFERFNVRKNLINILSDYKSVQKITKPSFEEEENDIDFEGMIPVQQQTRFLIKQNHYSIATLEMSKTIVRPGDFINLHLNFEGWELETKGLEIQLIKDETIYRDEYLKRSEYGDVYKGIKNGNHLERIIYEEVISSFNSDEINTRILVPANTESQFKTNFFKLNYLVQVKFILFDPYQNLKKIRKISLGERETSKPKQQQVDETSGVTEANGSNGTSETIALDQEKSEEAEKLVYDLKAIFTDVNGSILFRAVDHFIGGFEFVVRLPLVVLPSYEKDFGSVTSKFD